LLTTELHPITGVPGLSRLYLEYCSGAAAARAFYTAGCWDESWRQRPEIPAHWPELAGLLAGQNISPSPAAAADLDALRGGAGVVVTGQQVGLFGGPLFTPFKAATALARAREATAAGRPHVAIFWLATEDHDFAEINHVVFPARRELRTLTYAGAPEAARPVGGIVLDESITPLVDQARELLGDSEAIEALEAVYQPGRTMAQAFAEFYSKVFAAQGLLMLDASGREFHHMGAPVLRAALERADELHSALLERSKELETAGYHAQVAVGPQSSLLFLIDERTGARLALKRLPPNTQEPNGLWQAGRQSFSTADLIGILDAEPERISPSALLRPVFQDFLLSTSAIVGGPAAIAYFAQSAVLYAESAESLAQLLAARSTPEEGKRTLAGAGTVLEAELAALLEWMHSLDAGLGQSAETAANKMRYQMSRLRRLAANFQLQREASLTRQAEAVSRALYPGGALQERVHGAAYYFALYGFGLAEELTAQAAKRCTGHTEMWL
jgi:bacillithiol biosynthesis cysteine-adding enzyme BshC